MTVVLTSRQTGARFRLAPPLLSRMVRRRSRAMHAAVLLDRVVDRDLELVRVLPVHRRTRPVERLAALVMLAQAYRHYSAGWISRRELRHRSRQAFAELNSAVLASLREG
jgi:hypothetical protein